MNSVAPSLHATIKLQKENTPIRPVVSWNNSLAYNTAKSAIKRNTEPTIYIRYQEFYSTK
jgi:hypothetical protein